MTLGGPLDLNQAISAFYEENRAKTGLQTDSACVSVPDGCTDALVSDESASIPLAEASISIPAAAISLGLAVKTIYSAVARGQLTVSHRDFDARGRTVTHITVESVELYRKTNLRMGKTR